MLGLYFSGTGNTKHCTYKLTKLLDANAVVRSIEESGIEKELNLHKDIVLGYPIYYSSLPKNMHDFLSKNASAFAGKRIFIIVTMGLFSGDGAGCAARILRKSEAVIVGGLHLKMPDCIGDVILLKKSLAKNRRLIQNADRKIEAAAQNIRRNKAPRKGLNIFSHLLGFLGQRLWFHSKTANYQNKPDINYQKCVSCGKCVKLCPMKNLNIAEGKLTCSGKCTLCYRCVSHCPKQALTILGKKVHEQCYFEKYNS